MSEDKDLLEKEKQGREASDENMKEDEYEKVCFLCRRPESKTGPMITLPQNIHICTECMQKSFDTMNNSNMNYGAKSCVPCAKFTTGSLAPSR